MAGNPFRTPTAAPSQAAPAPTPASAAAGAGVAGREAAADDLSVDTSDTTVRPKKVVKRVRIQSPVVSPDEPRYDLDPFDARLNDEGHSGSPPPPDHDSDIAIELRKSFIDSVARGASNLNREAIGDVPPQAQRAGLGTETMASRAVQQQHQAPYNPFAKTLASIEGGYGTTAPASGSGLKGTEAATSKDTSQGTRAVGAGTSAGTSASVGTAKGIGKVAMDVDSFTRMLMTGKSASTIPSGGQPSPAAAVTADGTSTENSSDSRQSLFEPTLHTESPRSSYEASTSDAEMDVAEQSSLAGLSQPKKIKPPPPVHHRGKLLSHKGPQVVSFADFDTSLPPVSGQQSPSLPSPALSRSGSVTQPSIANKPLPQPPASVSLSVSPQSTSEDLGEPSITPYLQAQPPRPPHSHVAVESQPAKMRPPPPPVSRRSSQIRTDGPTTRPRSSSNLSRSSIPDDYHEMTSLHVTTSSLPQLGRPPPPPSRRAGTSVSSADMETAPSHSIPEAPGPAASTSASKAPPPPPSRHALRGGSTLTRTPSTQSTSSVGQRRVSPNISQAPPPPPPRRGDKRSSFDGSHLGPSARRPSDGGSQRSSVELRRSSGASANHARTPSVSSLQNVPEAEAGQDVSTAGSQGPLTGKDILADLSAFQAEIDALRAQIGN